MLPLEGSASLAGRKVTLGVCGGIAAYKAAELVRQLKKSGLDVTVIMTDDAARFVSPLTLSTLAGREVVTDLFAGEGGEHWTRHVTLGVESDLIVLAPATANSIAKIAGGLSDNMLTATVLAARCPVLVCPSMDHDMFLHPATERNLDVIRSFGYTVMQPEHGELASGLVGWGRMPEPDRIVQRIGLLLAGHAPAGASSADSYLRGRSVLVTAGPTREAFDPVRVLTNRSTGKMGFELAAECARRGGHVVLVAGPTFLPTPPGVQRVDVQSADEMYAAVQPHRDVDVVIAAAAVADYAPAEVSDRKIKKSHGELVLHLRRTRDVLADLGENAREDQVRIGFALETHDELSNARAKMEEKNLRWIVVNNPSVAGAGFGTETNMVTLLGRGGSEERLPVMPKDVLASRLLDLTVETLAR